MFAAIGTFAGTQPFNDWFAPDTTQRHPLGTKVTAVDPYWGEGEFIYVKSGAAILKGSVCMWGGTSIALGVITGYVAALIPNTANQGFPVGVAMAPMASGTFGWLQISGSVVFKTGSTVAADVSIGITAAGILGTFAAGKQIVNLRNTAAATATVTAVVNTTNGTGVLTFRDGYDGFFLGLPITGTGIPASTVIAKLDPDGRTVYTGSAIGTLGDKNSTATGSVTLTGTLTGFGQGVCQYPFAQGQIT
jgi:hypothetical protein